MPDLPVFPITAFFAASKRRSYRERTLRNGQVLLHFLESNNLAVGKLLQPDGTLDPTRDIRYSDLTPEGQQLMDIALDRWYVNSDRPGREESTVTLSRALRKLRETNNKPE